MPFYRVILSLKISRSITIITWHLFNPIQDLTNQTLANVIRQLASLTQFAEEIIGESSNALIKQQNRLESLSGRIELLDQHVQVLNPKHVGTWWLRCDHIFLFRLS